MSSFAEQMGTLAARSKSAERQALTEEATKTAVVLPFIQSLGFDVFNLDEVMPEFVADVGTKKGEKVDFAIKIDGKIAMLVEAKPINSKLGETQFSQLFRYFHVTEARLAILTNGKEAWFFSDIDEPNKMDSKPFFKFDFQNHDRAQVQEIARFQKECFAIDSIVEAASNLKYTRAAANYLSQQMNEPDDDFVRLVGRQIHEGPITKSVSEQLKPAIQAALNEIIRNQIQDKLSITLGSSNTAPTPKPTPTHEAPQADIETTEEEIEGFMIVRAIAAKLTPVSRITIRDAKSYCAILMDDNNRRPICRLYFNSATTKNIGLFDESKTETRVRVEGPGDIYSHADAIEAVVQSYLKT
ncbi:type I restriction endonuclease [Salipiger thiooxidans]|uniref:type I restriction endonuclease n=1 Tax=Salipiger thiooxidans TaxID=282683 RepID=UPI001CD296C0|nr:type I restriction endonuclease [Salipiger thiooxidans]MCA0851411.1 type I restriction enzyme HsdR N-terminal domain-containing protein [Salipiger thiooxidans]